MCVDAIPADDEYLTDTWKGGYHPSERAAATETAAAAPYHLQPPEVELRKFGPRDLYKPTEATEKTFVFTDTSDAYARNTFDTGLVPASSTTSRHSDAPAHLVREKLVLLAGLSMLPLPADTGSLHPWTWFESQMLGMQRSKEPDSDIVAAAAARMMSYSGQQCCCSRWPWHHLFIMEPVLNSSCCASSAGIIQLNVKLNTGVLLR
jgi:hypothetical protein